MTQKAAIAKALLEGKVLSIMNGFSLFGCTNLPREISRSIEKEFGVEVSRDKVNFKSKYNQAGIYYRYHLNRTEYNINGIIKMERYVEEQQPRKQIQPEQKTESQINKLF